MLKRIRAVRLPKLSETINMDKYFNINEGVFSQRSAIDDEHTFRLRSVLLRHGEQIMASHYTSEIKFLNFILEFNFIIFIIIFKVFVEMYNQMNGNGLTTTEKLNATWI